MFEFIYNFIQSWLFADVTTLSANTVEFASTLLTCFVLAFVIYLATLPFKWLFNLIRG